eukprot:TRINITY_DN11484_c0_g1_i1.p1 TRINITY_DN11484_c0_g1~~TRINITY_DN11484_c0_g1_i1.p1  ORF type:complete len:120 (+),score=7.90 TRINITY_DN11484_c0_g1_i1:29-361(+)
MGDEEDVYTSILSGMPGLSKLHHRIRTDSVESEHSAWSRAPSLSNLPHAPTLRRVGSSNSTVSTPSQPSTPMWSQPVSTPNQSHRPMSAIDSSKRKIVNFDGTHSGHMNP